MRENYPRWPTIKDISVGSEDYNKTIDLLPYMNSSPYVVTQTSSLSRIFQLFRTMGLRHLVVVGDHNEVLGIVTRKDLANIQPDHTAEHFRVMRALSKVRYIFPEDCEGYYESEEVCLP